MTTHLSRFFAVAGLAVSVAGIGLGQQPLDKRTALELLKPRVTLPVTGTFSVYPASDNERPAREVYRDLERAGVISCRTKDDKGKPVCSPGPHGGDLGHASPLELSFLAGSLVPAEVFEVTSTGLNTQVEFRLSLQATPLYSKYKDRLDRINTEAPTLAERTSDKVATAFFRLYDDHRWHYGGIDSVRELGARPAAPSEERKPIR